MKTTQTENQRLREYFKTTPPPSHYPKWFFEELGLWGQHHKEEDVRIYDHFKLKTGDTVLVNEIRRIEKHAHGMFIWEFIDRDTGLIFHFNDIMYKYEDD